MINSAAEPIVMQQCGGNLKKKWRKEVVKNMVVTLALGELPVLLWAHNSTKDIL